MRTLVISDLHLGERRQPDVLTRRQPLAALLDALADVERLVLLGDVVELSVRSPERALRVAEPVLRSLGRQLGPNREVVLDNRPCPFPGKRSHPSRGGEPVR